MKKLTLSLLCASMTLGATAEVLSPAEALQRAAGSSSRIAAIGSTATTPQPLMTVKASDELPAFYVFENSADKGYSIISADDIAIPLLGYSDEGSFDADEMPANMKSWLDFYAQQIATARANGATTDANVMRVAAPEHKAIAPICKTLWNQSAPYNNLCPKEGTKATYTGCVATAMAQVMKVYEYPAKCSGGSYTYLAKNLNKNLTLNFDNITLGWDLMLDDYSGTATSSQRTAVANLMYAVGVASQMDYASWASGTYALYMASGLIRNFGYSKEMLYVLREWYDDVTWDNMIYSILEGGHPVYYDGTNSAGHAFVVDGYQNQGYYHLNWGWGGTSNGYFRLSALDPTTQGIGGSNAGYNIGQGIIINMKPATEESENIPNPQLYAIQSSFAPLTMSTKKGSMVTFTGYFYNMSPCELNTSRLCAKFTSTTTGKTYYATGTGNYPAMSQYYGVNTFSATIPNTIVSGDYVVTPVVRDAEGNYFDVAGKIGGHRYFYAKVSGTSVEFTTPSYARIQATDFEVPSTVYRKSNIVLSATITNPTEEYYNNPVGAAIVSRSGNNVTVVSRSDAALVTVGAGETTELTINYAVPDTAKLGNFYMCLIDNDGTVVSDLAAISVKANPGPATISGSGFEVVEMAKNNLTFKLTASCSAGFYSDRMAVAIWSNGTYLTQFQSGFVTLDKGSSAEVTIKGDFENGVVGRTYQANAYYYVDGEMKQCSSMISFTLENESETSGINGISEDNAVDAPVEYFDLLGRKVASPRQGNIYLQRNGDTTSKILYK